MDASVRQRVRMRAGYRCEYCRLHEDDDPWFTFHVEHVQARQHGGGDDPDNLALACPHCNYYKGPNLSGIDPATGQVVPLFHPRRQTWKRHFQWQGPSLIGRTRCGRATVNVLKINETARATVREFLIAARRFPPQ